MPEDNPIRVAIVDDHEVVRIGLRNMIERQPDMVMAQEWESGQEAIDHIPGNVDVVVLDVRLPDINGMEVCRKLKDQDPNLRIIMLTSFGSQDLVVDAVNAGASGYLLKESRGRAVIDGIRTVAQGGALFGPEVTSQLLERLRNPKVTTDAVETLTAQEKKVLELIAQGRTNKEIGQLIFLSDKTVKHYVSNILSKLGYTRRSEAAAHFARYNAPETNEEN
ncbi:MAG: DNA-binding response regulator [Sulfobacillus thermosulfidooxidans]|uniref:response regulator n=1 Tax=Sulfobacillus TaxID=28033 RepID=UPI000CD0F5C9|nr:response regulator transcription factor [Sulfobacillus sp. hq2]POB12280.1 LuxR family transcriptional regulator [Sulfobacillus sp. hq2]PSR37542.1 MAG: DNA-binding response regulator [Sulfobacillus thermosulfidooxidans]